MGTKGLRYATEQRERMRRKRIETMKEKYGLATDKEVYALYAEWAKKSKRNKGGTGTFATNPELQKKASALGVEARKKKKL